MDTLNLSDRSGKRSSNKLAAEQATAQLQVAEQKGETSFMARTAAAEERLTRVSLAVEALEGRVGALVEDFRGRIEGTLQAFQGKGARQAKDLEKIAQLLGERWFQQFREQGNAAVERLREELKNSGRVVGEQAATGQPGRGETGGPQPSYPRGIWPATGASISGACAGDA